jgi:hypothetical protein
LLINARKRTLTLKLIYTNENRFLVNNCKNIVENAGIAVMLKNEYAFGGVGDLSPFDTWLELWVLDDADYDKAVTIIATALRESHEQDWECGQCHEKNDPSFEVCWQCQNSRG